MRYVIESMKQWERVFTEPDYWRPMVERILEREGLGLVQEIRAGYPGSNAVFWVNDIFIVKIFGQPWAGDSDRELEIYHHLAPYDNLLVRKVLSAGVIHAGQDWRYLVMEGLPSERLGDVWRDICRDNQLDIAADLGKIVQELHRVPVDGIQSMETGTKGWQQFVEVWTGSCVAHHRENNSLPEHLLAQIPDYLAKRTPLFPEDFSPCIIHSDLTEDHILLSKEEDRWQITGLIDFGDVEIGYRDYEFVALYLDAFNCDAEVMRAFLGVYDYPNGIDTQFNERMMAYSILHRYLNFKDISSLARQYRDLENVETLETLQSILRRV